MGIGGHNTHNHYTCQRRTPEWIWRFLEPDLRTAVLLSSSSTREISISPTWSFPASFFTEHFHILNLARHIVPLSLFSLSSGWCSSLKPGFFYSRLLSLSLCSVSWALPQIIWIRGPGYSLVPDLELAQLLWGSPCLFHFYDPSLIHCK